MTTVPRATDASARTRTRPFRIPDDVVVAVRFGAAAAAAVLAITSTGSAAIVAVALVVALADRGSALTVGLVVAAASLRYGSSGLDEWAGIQSVLGTGIEIGPVTAAASAWLCLVAVILAAGTVPGAAPLGAALDRIVPAIALGALGAAIAVGPGPDGDLWMRAVGTVVVSLAAFAMSLDRWPSLARRRRDLAVVLALVAVVAAGWPS